MSQLALSLLLLAVMLFGLVTIVLVPILPSLVIIWLAVLVFGLVTHFAAAGSLALFAVISVLMVGGSLIDNLLMSAGARRAGVRWSAITAALVAGVAGSLLWPPLGGVLATLIVLFLLEFYRLRNWRKALAATRMMASGCGWAVVARFFIGLVMIGLWAVWAFTPG